MKKLLISLFAIAATFSISAQNNTATTSQNGDALLINVDQDGSNQAATVKQSGSMATTTITQSGIDNPDTPPNNVATVTQVGGGSALSTININQELGNNITSITQEGNGSSVNVLQVGNDIGSTTNNSATIVSYGNQNSVNIEQNGFFNKGTVNQNSDNNTAIIDQYISTTPETENNANISQDGHSMGSKAYIYQNGIKHEAKILQSGEGDHLAHVSQWSDQASNILAPNQKTNIEQFGLHNIAKVEQGYKSGGIGENKTKIEQSGVNNTSEVVQMSDMYNEPEATGVFNNEVNISQSGNEDFLRIEQHGNQNLSKVNQNSLGSNAQIYQNGNDNTATVNQSMGANDVIINQN